MNKTAAILTALTMIGLVLFFKWFFSGSWIETPAPPAASPSLYSQADLPTNDELAPYLDQLVPAVNNIATYNDYCKENLDPISVGINRKYIQESGRPVFQVRCWKHGEKNKIIYFDHNGHRLDPSL